MRTTTPARKLTAPQRRDIERELEIERARLARALETAGTPVPLTAEDALDGAVEARTRARHAAILEAIGRLQTGAYGDCTLCGEPIPYGRLLAMPEADRCVACAQRA